MCKFRVKNKWGIYDTVQESFAIEPIYTNIFYCPETQYFLASKKVNNKSEKWGFINDSNEEVISFQFEHANTFSNGLAAVSIMVDDNLKYGYIDKAGNYQIPCEYDFAESFINGFAIVSMGGMIEDFQKEINNSYFIKKIYNGGKYTIIDKLNRRLFDFEFEHLKAYKENNSIYWTCETKTLIRVNGTNVEKLSLEKTSGKYDYIKYAGNGYFIAINKIENYEEEYFFIDDKGFINSDINKCYNYCTKFYEGIAAVKIIDKGYKSKYFSGEKLTIDFDYENIDDDFINIPTTKEYWYFINTDFNRVGIEDYEEVGFFRDGLCPVKILGKWGYVDKKGDVKISPKYQYAKSFNNGVAPVETNSGRWALLNLEGDEIVSDITAIEIGDFNDGVLWIKIRKIALNPLQKLNLFGFINLNGDIVIEPKYVWVSDFKEGFAEVTRNNITFWINTKGDEFI